MSLALYRQTPITKELDLEEMLFRLLCFGQPKLSMMDNGWHAYIKMHVAAKGATFEVASDFGLKSPKAAVLQLAERIVETLSKQQ